jgi:serine/threonine protein kinase
MIRLWTVLEPIRLGSVKQIMIENFPLGFNNEALIATILRDVLRAVQYLHNNNCIHNNIRADNIYLDANGDVKLGGLHQLIEKVSGGVLRGAVFKFVGDPEWMAPEVLSQVSQNPRKSS